MEPPRPLSKLPQELPRDIQAVAPIASRQARRDYDPRRRPSAATTKPVAGAAPDGSPPPADATVTASDSGPDRLVQALDRLRATNELRPVELEMARLAVRLYRLSCLDRDVTPADGLPVMLDAVAGDQPPTAGPPPGTEGLPGPDQR